MRVRIQRTIHADPSHVFDLFADAKAYAAAHASRCRSLTYRADSRTTATTQEEWLYRGRTYRIRHRVRLIPKKEVTLDTIDGIGRGARERVRLEAVPAGCRVRYEVQFSVPGALGPILEPLVAVRLRSVIESLADEDVLVIERRGRETAPKRPGIRSQRKSARINRGT